MNQSFENVDAAFVERLLSQIAQMGGEVSDISSGIAGSVELTSLTFSVEKSTVHFSYDNYGSGELQGPENLLAKISLQIT